MTTLRAAAGAAGRRAVHPSRRRSPQRSRGLLRAAGTLLLLGAVLAAAVAAAVEFVVPTAADAEARTSQLAASRGVSRSGAATPAKIEDALIATEDRHFLTNSGIDPAGVARWAWSTATGSTADSGGATIEQQLAKMLYTGGRRRPIDQAEQAALALKLNADFSKSQIMGMYLDTAYFGHGYYGVVAAAKGYFGLPPERLDWQQAALLAGLVQAPTAYDPLRHPTLALSRRGHVLDRLVAAGYLSAAQATPLRHASLGLR